MPYSLKIEKLGGATKKGGGHHRTGTTANEATALLSGLSLNYLFMISSDTQYVQFKRL